MRKLPLIVGILALLIASICSTIYIVNHPSRQNTGDIISVGMDQPEQIISAADLLATPRPRPSSSPLEALIAAAPEQALPADYSGVAYPQWEPGNAHIEGAQAVTESAQYVNPVWSPVGLDIAMTQQSLDGLFVSGALPGGTARRLTWDAGMGREFHWTPDGMSLRAKAEDGSHAEILITGERFPIPEPENKVLIQNDQVFYQREEGSPKPVSGLEDSFVEPLLSPDEKTVVYRGKETGLYIGLTDGTRAIAVGPGRNAAWLPDSSGIVFDLPINDGRTDVDGDLWLATVDGRTKTNLTNTPGIVESHPSVAPDGERIAFSAAGAVYVGKIARLRQ